MNVLVVGAGLAGIVVARQCAEAGHNVTVVDKRSHVGGNCYDYLNGHGERIHAYGPHLLHGSKDSVAVKWMSQFTEWVPYEHRVRALLPDGRTTPLPVNKTTLEDIFEVDLGLPGQTERFLDSLRVDSIDKPKNTYEVWLKNVGSKLTELFCVPYSTLMWNKHPREIEAAVGARIPVRTNRDNRYFTDDFQAMPKDGYTALAERALDHPKINVVLGREYNCRANDFFDKVFLSCPIDGYYDYCFGSLPYRSIRFKQVEVENDQPAVTVNYTHGKKYTRTTQWDLIPNSMRRKDGRHTTTIEEPCSAVENNRECYYPIRNEESLNLYQRYVEKAEADGLTFIGRLGTFRYLDMIPVVNQTLSTVNSWIEEVSPVLQ